MKLGKKACWWRWAESIILDVTQAALGHADLERQTARGRRRWQQARRPEKAHRSLSWLLQLQQLYHGAN